LFFFGVVVPGGTEANTKIFMFPYNYFIITSFLSTYQFKNEFDAMFFVLFSTDEIQINKLSISMASFINEGIELTISFGIIIGTGDILSISKQQPSYTTFLTLPANKKYVNQEFNNINIIIPANSSIFVFCSPNVKIPSAKDSAIIINVSFG
jgi:hypothetical protein